ncbi:MAG: serine hydrolase [Acidobacteriota bacterium]
MNNPEISEFLRSRIEANDFPSAVYLVAEKGSILFQDALGHAVVEPERIAAQPDTIYDVASLTKPLVTLLIIGKLVAEQELALTDLVYRYLPEFDSAEKSVINLERLLLHTAGLAAWRPFYLESEDRAGTLDFIARFPLVAAENQRVEYSDLGFTVLMFVVEKILKKRIDEAAAEEIFQLLGLKNTFYCPPEALKPRIAASEKSNEYERKTCIEIGYPAGPRLDAAIRKYQIWGEVHDGNAWFMNGVAGHAGLFSTAGDIFTLALQFLSSTTSILSPEVCELFATNFTRDLNEARSPGFQLAETTGSAAGPYMPPEAFGHLGFTGTSLWIDPTNERIFILLTNRTHGFSLPFININSVRRSFHSIAIAELDKNISN